MRLHAPAAERNAEPILAVLREVLPAAGTVLEVASGTGQHVATFAAALPALTFQPSEPQTDNHTSIAAWTEGLDNVRPPLALDVTAESWPIEGVLDAVFCANMIHIAPPEATAGLLRGAARHLRPGGVLVLYGPFRIEGAHTAPSNAAFDASLKSRDPRWGIRDLSVVASQAAALGLTQREVREMPANNKTVVFERIGSGAGSEG